MLRLVSVLAGLLACVASRAEDQLPLTAVYTIVDPSYHRARQADGKFVPETYAFGEGNFHSGAMKDASIDAMPFRKIAGILAAPLAQQGFVSAKTAAETKLLIVVHWGTTIPFNDGVYRNGLQALSAAMTPTIHSAPPPPPTGPGQSTPNEAIIVQNAVDAAQNSQIESFLMMQEQFNQQREKANQYNAALLGFTPALNQLSGMDGTPLAALRRDVVDDVEDERYFVILVAFDFQKIWKEKTRKILWMTRLSIRTRGHAFDKDLAAMAGVAAPYFGQETKAMVQTNRTGRVEMGTPEVISYETEKPKP